MKVQRAMVSETGQPAWIVLGDDYHPIRPVLEFLVYLHDLERSPNTLRSYAHHLKLFWEYLREYRTDWAAVRVPQLAGFVGWLRRPNAKQTASTGEPVRGRRECTVNTVLAAVSAFYDYHERLGTVSPRGFYQERSRHPRPYKSFLYHVSADKPARARLVKLRESTRVPATLTAEQVQQLVKACRRTRDRFLVCLLYETGMRIGQALGLRHEDIRSYDNEVRIVPRVNANGARGKTRNSSLVHVSKQLMELYADYLIQERSEIESDYVFVNCWGGERGRPMSYANAIDLFRRLQSTTGIKTHPHVLRHSHATDLIRGGMGLAFVQKRLGHAQIQTTVSTYAHLDDEDLRAAFATYLAARKAGGR